MYYKTYSFIEATVLFTILNRMTITRMAIAICMILNNFKSEIGNMIKYAMVTRHRTFSRTFSRNPRDKY